MPDVDLRENKQIDKMLKAFLNSDDFVKIGVIGNPENGNAADDKHDGSDLSIIDIAVIHEFGAPKANIPQRSFIRSTYANNKDKINELTFDLMDKESQKSSPDLDKVLHLLGNIVTGMVKRTFRKNNWDRLNDPTRGGKNKKGGATPLIDTGQLVNSISYEVVRT